MQEGSLAECIKNPGQYMSSPPVTEGEILTVTGNTERYGKTFLFFYEKGEEYAYLDSCFREIQKPININIENLILEEINLEY